MSWNVLIHDDPHAEFQAIGCSDQRRFYKKLIVSADARFDGHLATLKRVPGVFRRCQCSKASKGKKSWQKN